MIEITEQTLPDVLGDIEKIIEKITQITVRYLKQWHLQHQNYPTN